MAELVLAIGTSHSPLLAGTRCGMGFAPWK